MANKRKTARAILALLAAVAAWSSVPSAFTGYSNVAPQSRSSTQMNGYRLDWMLEGKLTGGDDTLQTQDGYWVGETGFERSQNAQGLRYRCRPTAQEYKEGKECGGLMYAIGPVKFKVGEMFSGSATNAALRDLKRKLVKEGITDPNKIEENKYWKARFGAARWEEPYIDQVTGVMGQGLFRGLAAWSGKDPKKEERGVTWFEADWGKPWIKKYIGTKLPGYVSGAQVEKEYDRGKLNGKYLSLPKINDNTKNTGLSGPDTKL